MTAQAIVTAFRTGTKIKSTVMTGAQFKAMLAELKERKG